MKTLTRLSIALVLSSLMGVSAGAAISDAISDAVSAKQPIELVITDDPRSMDSKYYYYNFGSVTVHYRESADFVFRNRSSSSVYFNNITISGSAYRAYSGCPYRLNPGNSCVTRVDFVPWYEGYHYGRLGFWYNGGSIIIDLQGYGRSW